jgi:TolB-like protein/lipoprotein NlpI
LQLRIGIHLGDVMFEENDVFGDGVNIASRLQAIASPGAIYISEAVHNNIANKKEINTKFVRAETLKNVKEPVKIYSVKTEDYNLTDTDANSHSGKVQRKRFNEKKPVLFLLAGIVIIAIGLLFYFKNGDKSNSSETAETKKDVEKSIAVLPFVNMSNDKEQEYFSDGLSEELLNLLAKIPELKVIGRTSSFSFKGKNEDLRSIAQKLGVAHLLEGSVRKNRNRIRVSAQLIKASDGSHLWSETYDRDLEDIFKLQDEIAGAVVKQLKLKLITTTANTASYTTNNEVYNLILQGNYFAEKRDKENLAKALDFYLKALAIDSLNARSWAAVAQCYELQTNWGWIDRNQGVEKAREAATKSIELDGTLAGGHMVLGKLKMYNFFDWDGAEAEFEKALNLEPANADVLKNMGILYRTIGRFDEAIRLSRQSIILDPVKSINYFNLGQILYYANHLEEAIASYKKILELNPQFPRTHTFLGKVYLLQGKPEMAFTEMQQETEKNFKDFGMVLAYHSLDRRKEAEVALTNYITNYKKDWTYQIAEIYAFRGEKDKAIEWLEKAFLVKDGALTYLKGDPLLKNLESEPRHTTLLKKMNLPVD